MAEGEPKQPQELVLYGQGTMANVYRQVLALFPSEFYTNLIFVVPSDVESIRQAQEELKNNPLLQCLILSNPGKDDYLKHEINVPLASLLSQPRVTYLKTIHLPEILQQIQYLQEKSQDRSHIPDDTKTIRQKTKDQILRTLNHDLKDYVIQERGERFKQMIQQAREVFDIKPEASDESVVTFVQTSWKRPEIVRSDHVDGVYCDIDDTLLLKDGTLNVPVLRMLEAYEQEGKKIFIWTGGDVGAAKQKLKGTPLEKYSVVSKYDYAGATAEIIIDNVSEDKFLMQTNIKAKQFIRV